MPDIGIKKLYQVPGTLLAQTQKEKSQHNTAKCIYKLALYWEQHICLYRGNSTPYRYHRYICNVASMKVLDPSQISAMSNFLTKYITKATIFYPLKYFILQGNTKILGLNYILFHKFSICLVKCRTSLTDISAPVSLCQDGASIFVYIFLTIKTNRSDFYIYWDKFCSQMQVS